MTKIKVTIPNDDEYGDLKGKVLKLDAEAFDFGGEYVSTASLKDTHIPKSNVETDIQQRLAKQSDNLRASLLEDDDHIRKILTAKGVPMNEDGTLIELDGISAEDLATKLKDHEKIARAEFEKEDLNPRVEEITDLNGKIEKLQRQVLHAEILDAARSSGVIKEKFDRLPGAPISSTQVIAQTEGNYGFDKDNGRWALKNEAGDGFVHNPVKEDGRPFAGPEVYFDQLKEDKAVAESWFGDDRPKGGPGVKPVKTPTDSVEEGEYDEKERVKALHGIRQTY